MAIKIGHASSDERGKLYGGATGDQNGREVYIRTWYRRPWNYIIRAKDYVMRDKIAYAMEAACKNDLIGYDQYQRNGCLLACKDKGFDPSKITDWCETDCSALVSVCCMYAGIPMNVLYVDKNSSTTSTIRKRLMSTGMFDVFTDAKHTDEDSMLMRGDILLYEGHHVAVALDDGASVVRNAPVSTVVKQQENKEVYKMKQVKRGDKNTHVLVLQFLLNKNGCDCGAADGDFGKNTEAALKAYQKKKGLTQDGICGAKTWGALLS